MAKRTHNRINSRREKIMAKLFILTGLIFLGTGVLLYFLPGLFSWFGKLPGDIRIASGNTFVFIPLTSMVVLSLALTVIVNLLGWLITLFSR